MKESKIFSLITAVLLSFVTTGCNSSIISKPLILEKNDKIAEERFNEILQALEEKNMEAIKSMFSVNSKDEIENLDEKIASMFYFYNGKMQAYEVKGSPYTAEYWDSGDKSVKLYANYVIETDKEKYYLFFIERSNTSDLKDNGLYMLELRDEKDQYYSFEEQAGLFTSGDLKAENYLEAITTALTNSNYNLIQSLFANNIKDEIDLYDESLKIANLFEGRLKSFKELNTSVNISNDIIITKGYYEVAIEEFMSSNISGTYLIYFIHRKDRMNLNEDGLYTLEIVEKTNENTVLKQTNDAGIFIYN